LTVQILVFKLGGMTVDGHWSDDIAFPALLRSARSAYATEIRRALIAADCHDLPRNGSFVLGAIARNGSPLREVTVRLGISKQAAGQLVDTLVERGYLDRRPDADDRRRVTITLTKRGRVAATAGRRAVGRVDARLAEQVGADDVARTRRTLAALTQLG
jgi:DNA-binding MarR family transcriptional regulator